MLQELITSPVVTYTCKKLAINSEITSMLKKYPNHSLNSDRPFAYCPKSLSRIRLRDSKMETIRQRGRRKAESPHHLRTCLLTNP